jgi:hypothetical protein
MHPPPDLWPSVVSSVSDHATLSSISTSVLSTAIASSLSSHQISLSTTAATMLSKTLQPTATLITAIAAATTTASDPNHGDENNGECQLLGPFAILVQGALGALALLSLVYKRWRERPQRPLKIWAFDASKQVFGTVLLHLANLLMSMFSAGQLEVTLAATSKYQPNPCSFYLLNLGIDVCHHFDLSL